MRQSQVNRSVIALSCLLLLACAGFAWVVEHPPSGATAVADPPPADAPANPASTLGGELFAERCARCHEPGEAAEQLPAGADARAILRRHDKSPAEDDDAIIAFLATQRPPDPAAR